MAGLDVEQLADGLTLYCGDMLDVLPTLDADSVDAIVCDPPYGLTANKKGGTGEASLNVNSPAGRSRIGTGGGFMGKEWDSAVPSAEHWRQCIRVLKPGGHLLAFAGTRTQHRMATAIEDAGFEIRDMIAWVYGQGWPKSQHHLKPALEPITVARKPLSEKNVAANVLKHGCGGLNIDACRVEASCRPSLLSTGDVSGGTTFRQNGGGGSCANGVTDLGRWPPNLAHDGSPEVLAGFPQTASGLLRAGTIRNVENNIYGKGMSPAGRAATAIDKGGDSGSAARFFAQFEPDPADLKRYHYTSKADSEDRLGSAHVSVKPLDLMRWLVRLVTRPGGLVLDPYAGTGSTGEAALREGMRAILIEREAEHQADIRKRIALMKASKRERRHAIGKAKVERRGDDLAGTLFGGNAT